MWEGKRFKSGQAIRIAGKQHTTIDTDMDAQLTDDFDGFLLFQSPCQTSSRFFFLLIFQKFTALLPPILMTKFKEYCLGDSFQELIAF
jgi:hypothetical protein